MDRALAPLPSGTHTYQSQSFLIWMYEIYDVKLMWMWVCQKMEKIFFEKQYSCSALILKHSSVIEFQMLNYKIFILRFVSDSNLIKMVGQSFSGRGQFRDDYYYYYYYFLPYYYFPLFTCVNVGRLCVWCPSRKHIFVPIVTNDSQSSVYSWYIVNDALRCLLSAWCCFWKVPNCASAHFN